MAFILFSAQLHLGSTNLANAYNPVKKKIKLCFFSETYQSLDSI